MPPSVSGGPVVIASHLPGEGHFHSDRFEVIGWECVGDFGYWEGVAAHWESDRTLVLVEHDIEVTDEHVAELAACPHGACSWAYVCHWASTGTCDRIAAGAGERAFGGDGDPGYLTGGEEWAAWSAIGLVKIAPEARIGPLRREPWDRLELAVHDAVKRPWHMHGNGSAPGDFSGHVDHHHW